MEFSLNFTITQVAVKSVLNQEKTKIQNSDLLGLSSTFILVVVCAGIKIHLLLVTLIYFTDYNNFDENYEKITKKQHII